jgi:hypothetical protein
VGPSCGRTAEALLSDHTLFTSARGTNAPRARHAALHPEALQFDHFRADKLFPVGVMTETEGRCGPMTDQQDPIQEPESNSLVGYAAIKYTAIVIIVLSILAFLAWYVVPRLP